MIDTPYRGNYWRAVVGAAMAGFTSGAEIMYVEFYTSGDGSDCPIRREESLYLWERHRFPLGAHRWRCRQGDCSSPFAESGILWTHFPGIYVVMPSTPYDAKGLLKSAIRDDNPIMFIEHKMLYKEKERFRKKSISFHWVKLM